MIPNIRLSLTLALSLGAAVTAGAQDKIHLKNGSTLEVKVEEVAPRTITYKRWDNRSGPNYIINKSEVDRISYQNGGEDEITDDGDDRFQRRGPGGRGMAPRVPRWNRSNNARYGNNIISLAPMQMTNEGAAGIGLHFEHMLDKRQMFSLYVPFAVTLMRDNNNYYNGPYPLYVSDETHAFYSIFPGIKIYPTGSNGVVRYAVGPSLAIGFGNKYYTRELLNSQGQFLGYQQISDDVLRLGMMINNSINITPNPHLYLGLELGIGFTYSSTEDNYYNYSSVGLNEPLVQFNFKIGYRF